jgi:hypothetical protein
MGFPMCHREPNQKDKQLNVKVKKFNQARVNGGSNYDSQPVREAIVGGLPVGVAALCLLVDLVKLLVCVCVRVQ